VYLATTCEWIKKRGAGQEMNPSGPERTGQGLVGLPGYVGQTPLCVVLMRQRFGGVGAD